MKLLKFPVLAMLAVAALATSCSDDGSWDAYDEKGDVYTFDQATANYNFTPVTVQDQVVVTLTRKNTAEAASLPIAAEFSSEALSGPAEVYFEKGENQADYVISVGELTIGETVTAALAFNDELVSVSGDAACNVSITLDYTWLSAGSCQMVSSWAGNETPIRVPIEVAAEGEGLYRLNSPYYYLEPDYCPNEGYHLQFYLDENYNALAFVPFQFIGETAQGYQVVLGVWPNGANGSSFYNQENLFVITGLFLASADGTATSFAGAFAQAFEYFLWDKGYPGVVE